MRWQGREESKNVEDARGLSAGGTMAIGGGVGSLILILVLSLLGVDPRPLMDAQGGGQAAISEEEIAAQQPLVQFVGVVLKDTEDVWESLTPELRRVSGDPQFTYRKPKLKIFSRSTDTACGRASAAVGPFYCPGDEKVYIDLVFFTELQSRFKAPGDFAMAYVVAHEVGHHIQKLLGLSAKVQQMQSRVSEIEANQWSVRLELQADYLAGVWAHHGQKMKSFLEKGDLEEALNAASNIGDDKLQEAATGRVRQEAFTHGSAKQRVKWLREGIRTGDLSKLMLPFELEYNEL